MVFEVKIHSLPIVFPQSVVASKFCADHNEKCLVCRLLKSLGKLC